MKKFLSIVLSALMLVSVMSVTAYAANNGPKGMDEIFYGGFISEITLYETDGKGNIKTERDPEFGYLTEVGTTVFSKNGAKKTDGVSYDEKTNTLTLKNLKASDKVLSYSAMGDDFKINVVGSCSLAAIEAHAMMWSSSVTFTGSGTLTVNSNKVFDYGFRNNSYGTASAITFGKGVKVNISGKKNSVFVEWSNRTNPAELFVFNSNTVVKVASENTYNLRTEWGSGYRIDKSVTPDYIGQRAKCLSDPDGIYIMGKSTRTDDLGNETKGHWVEKLVYSESLGLYVRETFEDGASTMYLYPGDKDYDNYVSEEEILYNTEKRFVWADLKKMTDSKGNKYVYGDVWDNEKTKCVATYEEISDVNGTYLFKSVKEGEEAEAFAETLTPAESEMTPIGEGVYRDSSYIGGVFVKELEMDSDHLGVRVKSGDDPDGFYFMTEGTRYENYGEENEKHIPSRWVSRYIYVEDYNFYFLDESFGDGGSMTFDYDSFDTSDFTLVDTSEDPEQIYNYGCVSYVNGTLCTDKGGNKYIVESIDGGEYGAVYRIKEIPELRKGDEKKYYCTPADDVDTAQLTASAIKEPVKNNMNFYIESTELNFDGTNSAPTPAVKKKANTMAVKASAQTLKAKTLKSKKQTISPLTIKKAQGKVTVAYVKKGTSKKIQGRFTVSGSGKITFKKGKYAKNTYKICLKVSAKGNTKYKSASKTVTVTVKVK